MELSKHADRFINSDAAITSHDHLVLIDREKCAKTSALRKAKHRFIVYDVSAKYAGEWCSYKTEQQAEYVTAKGMTPFA
jgi:hypothetical protein